LCQQSTQPAASALTTSDVDTSSAEPVTTSTDPLLGSASTRASTTATPPQSVQLQQAVLTCSSHPSPRIHRPTTTMMMTRIVSSPFRDSRISSSHFWVP
jgi:hypothetical protein